MGLYAYIANACSRAFPNRTAVCQHTTDGTYGVRTVPASPHVIFQSDHMTVGPLHHQTAAALNGNRRGTTMDARPCTGSRVAASVPALTLRTPSEQDHHQPVDSGRRVRMVISGRMADVCAELERLVALDHQMNTSTLH